MTDAADPLDPQRILETALEPLTGEIDDPSVIERIEKALPGYEIEAPIGRGGMAAVYRGRDKKLGRTVAIKVLRNASDDPGFDERFRREARVLAQLDHPNIVTLFDFGESDNIPYLVTQYVDGSNLRALIGATPPPLEEALRILEQVCDALDHAHRSGLVHRDVKPENILIDADGRVRLADFGLVQIVDAHHRTALTATRQGMGTLHYMAPEQMEQAQSVDARADVYALGVVAYELLTGRLPIGRFDPPSAHRPLPKHIDEAVLRCLAADPATRLANAVEAREALTPTHRAPVPAADDAVLSHARLSVLGLGLVCLIAAIITQSVWNFGEASSEERLGLTLGLVAMFVAGHVLPLSLIDVEWLARARFPGLLPLRWRVAYEVISRGFLLYAGGMLIVVGGFFWQGSANWLILVSGALLPLTFLGLTGLANSPIWRVAVTEARRQRRSD